MALSKIEIDRHINSLRVSSKEFSNIENNELISMFEECINNIKEIAYYWATVSVSYTHLTLPTICSV